jgi:hypothetical protein
MKHGPGQRARFFEVSARLPDERFDALGEAKGFIEAWRWPTNPCPLHARLGLSIALEVSESPAAQPRPAPPATQSIPHGRISLTRISHAARMSAGGLRVWAHDFSPRHTCLQRRRALVERIFGAVGEVSMGRG